MSFVRNRCVSQEPLGGLGFLGCRPLGSGSPAIRLPPAVPCPSNSVSGSDSSPQLFPQLHPGVSFDSCGCRSPCEGGSRASPLRSGVLQSPLCHPQSHWGLPTGDRPLTPQPFGSGFQFPHGDCRFGSPVTSSGGLDGVPRSSGRLPSASGASVIAPLPAVLHGVCCPPVSRAVLRPVVCPAGFHAGHGPCLIMHRYGFHILRYLDDWLVLGSSFQEVLWPRDFLLWLCHEHGIRVNPSKSSLDPTQTLDYLGMSLQTRPLRVFPTQKRVLKLSSLLQEFVSCQQQPLELWRQLLGVMSSLSAIVPGSRLLMRALQLRLNTASRHLPAFASVSWDDSCLEDLRWWSVESHLTVGFWVFQLRAWLCTRTPQIPVGEPVFRTTICPACGLRVVSLFRSTTGSFLRCSTESRVSFRFFRAAQCPSLPTTPPLSPLCRSKGAPILRRSMQ